MHREYLTHKEQRMVKMRFLPKKLFFTILPALSLLFLCGCFMPAYRGTQDFDLDVEPVPCSGKVSVSYMRNASSAGTRIQWRSYFDLTRDPYNVWALEPGALVCCALNRALCRDRVQPEITLCGEIECFEADLTNRVFRLSGFYRRTGTSEKIRFDITSPMRAHSVENIVLAASESVRKLARRMADSENGNKRK